MDRIHRPRIARYAAPLSESLATRNNIWLYGVAPKLGPCLYSTALFSAFLRNKFMARITVEDCLDNVENIFELVLVAAKRARRIAHGADPMVELENDKPTVVALREIAEGLVTSSILEEIEQPMAEELLQPEATDEILPVRGISIGD